MTEDEHAAAKLGVAIKRRGREVSLQLQRARRADLVWQRQRAAFLQLLADSMEEFDITRDELMQVAPSWHRERSEAGGHDEAYFAEAPFDGKAQARR